MKTKTIIALLTLTLAACAPAGTTPPVNLTEVQNTAIAAVWTDVALTQTALPTATLEATPAIALPTILPTLLTIAPTLNPTQEVQVEEIKNVIQAYFEMRYQALSVSPPEDFQINGFGDLVSDSPDAMDFLTTEMAKLAVQRKWIDLNRFGYVKYEYSLKYKDIVIDTSAQIATVSLLEDFAIVHERAMERDPDDPSTTRGDQSHEIVLHNEQDQWKIVSDIYWDAWWRSYRKPGRSTDEILREINEEMRELEAMPTATPMP